MTHPAVYGGAVSHHARTFLPSGPPTYFRILVPLPLTVAFPSVVYVLEFQSVPAAGRHELVANSPGCSVWHQVGPRYFAREFLETAAHLVGVPAMPATVGLVILQRLAREGRAVWVPAPADDLTQRRPAERDRLGAWVRDAACPAAGRPVAQGARS